MSPTPSGEHQPPPPGLEPIHRPSTVRPITPENRRLAVGLAVIIAGLVTVSVLNRLGPSLTGMVIEPIAAVMLILLARRQGLTWHDLGLSRRTWRRGLCWAGAGIGVVALVYVVGIALPITRDAFVDSRYQLSLPTALLTGFVLIPLGTIALEEVAFRGVLMGLLGKSKPIALAISVSSVLFGLWHVLPSLALGANKLVASVIGHGLVAQIVMVVAVVVFTGAAGWLLCEVRRRSGSLLAPMGLHWATNGLGVLLTSALWSLKLA